MEEFRKTIDITPDKTIFPKLGQAGYTVPEALSELIDNSIDARGSSVNIEVRMDFSKGEIVVSDDGSGMSEKQAMDSIVLGKSSKQVGNLGQFGIGLKTACMSLGKEFIVETTSLNSDELYIVRFDEEEFLRNGSWSDFEIKVRKGVDKEKSGTKIVIRKLRIKPYGTLINVVRDHLAERFSPFIKNREAKITVNSHILKPEAEKIVEGTKQSFEISLSSGQIINGWSGILEVGSMDRSGFNLYRYNRLIRAHEKLGYAYHPSKMWITGEIFMDPIPVTHNKREFITEDPLYIEFFEKFLEILKPILAEAQRRHQEEKIKDLPRELRETLKDNILKALNRIDDLKELAFPEIANKSKNDEGILDDREARDTKGDVAEIETEPPHAQHKRTPRKQSENKNRFITIAGKRYKFEYEWRPLDPEIAKESYLDKETGTIIVILNSNYHLLNVVKPDWFYHAVYLTEGIVQVFLKENDQSMDRLVSLRDSVVKQLSDVVSEDTEERIATRDSQMLKAQSYLVKNTASEDTKLSDNEKLAIKLRLENNSKYKDIADQLNCSRQRAEQLVKSALAKINGVAVESIRRHRVKGDVERTSGKSKKGSHESSQKVDAEFTVDSIMTSVSKSYGVSVDDLLNKNRNAELVLPRHMIMFLLREQLGLSFPEIAKIMKRNDHSTVMHAYKKIKRLMQQDNLFTAAK